MLLKSALWTLSSNGCLHQISHFRAWELKEIGSRKYKHQKGWRTPGEQGHQYQLSKACVNSQRLKQQTVAWQGSAPVPLHMYYGFQFSVFMRLQSVRMSGFLILTPSPGFFSLLVCTVQLWCDHFYFILLYFILLRFIIIS